jgi:two-component system chemotaxis response regulator CheY
VPKSILVVDDSVLVRRMLRSILDSAGYRVSEAVNGADAVEIYAQLRPDLVTMDLAMPGMGGLEAIAAIKALDPAARIVVVSALGRTGTGPDAKRAGACAYVQKPFQPAAILDTVRKCLLAPHTSLLD